MREIKFRAWIDEADKLAKVQSLKIFGDVSYIYLPEDDYEYQIPTSCIQQFTGLKDKNRKEIYEGDITGEKSAEGLAAVCRFEDGSFTFVAGAERSPCQMWYIENNSIEVIGNLFENPELLTPASST